MSRAEIRVVQIGRCYIIERMAGRLLCALVCVFFCTCGLTQQTAKLTVRGVERLLKSEPDCDGCDSGVEWYAPISDLTIEPDTFTISRAILSAESPCFSRVWQILSGRHCHQYELRRCQEPPVSVQGRYGVGLRYKVTRQWGRVYITFHQGRLRVSSYEVLALEEGSWGLIGGVAPQLTLRRVSP